MARFGPAGNSPAFYQSGGKTSREVPAWLKKIGLTAYEYQCGRGVRIKEATARDIGDAAKEWGIAVSIHGPYYINLANSDGDAQQKTANHFRKSLQAADWMNASPVVFHPGGVGKLTRAEALNLALKNLEGILTMAEKEGYSHIKLAPETMGKKNQLGNLDEVLELCCLAENVVPTIDFAHLHAVSGGGLTKKEHFLKIAEKIEAVLGRAALEQLHIHFSPIEYTSGGEKKHRNLEDTGFGPDFLPLAQIIDEQKLSPTVICESSDRQADDALIYKQTLDDVSNA